MRRRLILVLLVLVLPGLTGCAASPYGREPEDTVPVRVLGVDVWGDEVTLTAIGTDSGGKTAVQTVTAHGLDQALLELPTAGDRYLSLANVIQLVLGDGVDVIAVLDKVLEDGELSYNATVWAVAGFAGPLLAETEDGGVSRFEVLEQGGTEGVSVKTALAGLLTDGKTVLPALTVTGGLVTVVGNLSFEVI